MPLLRFFGALVGWLALLLLLWLFVGGAFAQAYAATLEGLLSSLGGNRALSAEVLSAPRAWIDVELRLFHRDMPEQWLSVPSSSFLHAYLPAATLFAIVAAAPLARRERWKCIVIGQSLLLLVALVRVGAGIAPEFARIQVKSERLFDVTRETYLRLDSFADLAYRDPSGAFLVALVIAGLLLAPRANRLAGAFRSA